MEESLTNSKDIFAEDIKKFLEKNVFSLLGALPELKKSIEKIENENIKVDVISPPPSFHSLKEYDNILGNTELLLDLLYNKELDERNDIIDYIAEKDPEALDIITGFIHRIIAEQIPKKLFKCYLDILDIKKGS